MIRIKIHLVDQKAITTENNAHDFVAIVSEIFKKRIYVALTTDGRQNMAINTDNITFIEEVEKV